MSADRVNSLFELDAFLQSALTGKKALGYIMHEQENNYCEGRQEIIVYKTVTKMENAF